MYRIVFFKIPFMRGGYRVPACPFGDKPITHMAGYKVAEIVTDFAFAETQREIVVNGDTAIAIDNGAANYVYIAQTNSEAIGVYTSDRRPAYYWVDDLQFVGVQGNDTPAAVVTISPDVWLTDFFPNMPIIMGRVAQSSDNFFQKEPKTPLINPIFDAGEINQFSPFLRYPDMVFLVGVFVRNDGGVSLFGTEMVDSGSVATVAQRFGGAASITMKGISGETTWQVSCVKLYALPYEFINVIGTETTIIDYGLLTRTYTLQAADGTKQDIYPVSQSLGRGGGMKRVFDVKISDSAFTNINSRRYIATPARFVELSEINGISVSAQSPITIASFYICAAPDGDDNVGVYMQISGEFYDVTNDFLVDFAANTAAIEQAQQKQLVALQAITGVIGAAGGVAGGIASGNYFGAVQAAAGGMETIASIGAARRTPASIKTNGGALSFLYSVGSLIIIVSMGTPRNNSEMETMASEFGWILDNSPFALYARGFTLDTYYRFSEVTVYGLSGGQSAQQEIANALVSGVRLVDISKL